MNPFNQLAIFSGYTRDSLDFRELFIGSIPSNTIGAVLLEFLNLAMKESGLADREGVDPAINCHITGYTHKFAFIEFRTAREASNALNMNEIPFMGNPLKIKRSTKYQGQVNPHLTWSQLILTQSQHYQSLLLSEASSQQSTLASSPPISENIKSTTISPDFQSLSYRELFIEGINSTAITESMLVNLLGGALEIFCFSNSPGNPIIRCRMQAKFAFLELRSTEETTNCLNLNGFPLFGCFLRISRPTSYSGPVLLFYAWEEFSMKWLSGELKLKTSGPPSCVIQLSNLILPSDIDNPVVTEEVVWDIDNECQQFGNVVNVSIQKTGIHSGHLFVQMDSIEAAKKVLIAVKGRSYDGKIINCQFFTFEKFSVQNFSDPSPPIILTATGPIKIEDVIGTPTQQSMVSQPPY